MGCVAGACDGVGGASQRLATKTQGRCGLWWWSARRVAPGLTYNARRQRTGIVYGNGVETALSYDAESFRLTRLYTTREVATDTFVGQDRRYAYDAVGNITRMDDHAVMVDDEERMVHAGPQLAEPVVHAYTYDALGRLITATGREHPGLLPTTTPLQPGSSGYDRGGPHPNDLAALEDYVEQYTYDAVGNFVTMQHTVPSDTTHSWTRYYLYDDIGNRLTKTHGGNATGTGSYSYGYDEHGNMLAMPHLAEMDWNAYEELTRTDNGGGAGRVEHHFQYDAAGQRVRKVVEHYTSGAATLIEERVYFGGFELYRRHQGAGSGLDKEVVRELQTLHVMDGEQRVALVDTRTVEMAPEDEEPTVLAVEARTTRVVYQLGNHLGSACLEVDEDGEVVRYEEFHPYGSSALLYAREGEEDEPKRYRFTGMECDDTGLQYHSARYFAPWLGRWNSTDPLGTLAGPNSYAYCDNNPTNYADLDGRDPVPGPLPRTSSQPIGRPLGAEVPSRFPHTHTHGAEPLCSSENTEPVDLASRLSTLGLKAFSSEGGSSRRPTPGVDSLNREYPTSTRCCSRKIQPDVGLGRENVVGPQAGGIPAHSRRASVQSRGLPTSIGTNSHTETEPLARSGGGSWRGSARTGHRNFSSRSGSTTACPNSPNDRISTFIAAYLERRRPHRSTSC